MSLLLSEAFKSPGRTLLQVVTQTIPLWPEVHQSLQLWSLVSGLWDGTVVCADLLGWTRVA